MLVTIAMESEPRRGTEHLIFKCVSLRIIAIKSTRNFISDVRVIASKNKCHRDCLPRFIEELKSI